MKRNTFFKSLLLLITTTLTISLLSCNSWKKPEPPKKATIKDTVEVYEPTVQDILSMRDEMRRYREVDSIFLAMPNEILVHILVTTGITENVDKIVTKYLENKDFYDKELRRALEIQKKYLPDSLPKQPKPEKKMEIKNEYESLIL